MRNLQIEQTPIHALRPHRQNARTLSLPQIKSVGIDGAAHQGQAALRYARRAERAVEPAHPCLMRDAFGLRCSTPYKP